MFAHDLYLIFLKLKIEKIIKEKRIKKKNVLGGG